MALFGKEKPEAALPAAPRSDQDTAFFGGKLSVKGKVSGSGNLIVMGKLEGEFDLNGELVIAPPAVLNGEIKAVNITVSGNVTGNLTAREKIHLEKSAVVNGRLNSPRLSVAEGAVFNGDVEMKKPAEAGPASRRSAQK
jgi:cytoskeletal protein CcmA (bactofilin family)